MPAPGTISDGSFLFASEDITLNSVVYYSKTIRVTGGLKRVEGPNSAGVTIRKGYIKNGYLTGSLDLMYPSATAAAPKAGDTFTMTIPEISATALNCIVLTATANRSNDAEATCSVDWDELIHGLSVTDGHAVSIGT